MVHPYMYVWRANATWIAFPLSALYLGNRASLNSLMAAGLAVNSRATPAFTLQALGLWAHAMASSLTWVLGITTGNFLTNPLARPALYYNHS